MDSKRGRPKKSFESANMSAEKILSSARSEFAEHGFAGARVDRIAERAKVNKAMIYYHFKSKENLYQTIIDQFMGAVGDFIEQNFTENPDLENYFYQLAECHESLFRRFENFKPIFLREIAAGGERIITANKKYIVGKGLTRKLKVLIDQNIAAGKLREIDYTQVIISFIGMSTLYHTMAPILNTVWGIEDEEEFLKKRKGHLVDLLLNGIKKK